MVTLGHLAKGSLQPSFSSVNHIDDLLHLTEPSPMRLPVVALTLLAFAVPQVHAELVTYDIVGGTSVGGAARTFTGSFVFDNAALGSTVYFPGESAPVQQGFSTTYTAAARGMSLTLDNGETLTGQVGALVFSNIQQSEAGAQLPAGLSVQAYLSNPQGTINGITIQGLYLAFAPVASNYSWDALDAYFGGNAETLLQDNPSLLPPGIDPALTGTALPADLQSVFPFTLNPSSFSTSQFIGTMHTSPSGMVTTVNYVSAFNLHVAQVPEPGTALMFLGGLGALAARRRHMNRHMMRPTPAARCGAP